MKQTALEWLDEQLQIMDSKSYNNLIQIEMGRDNYRDMIQQAKEMFENQIMDAYEHGQNNGYMYRDGNSNIIQAEQYYNETFKSE
jgi:hypothetical protein